MKPKNWKAIRMLEREIKGGKQELELFLEFKWQQEQAIRNYIVERELQLNRLKGV